MMRHILRLLLPLMAALHLQHAQADDYPREAFSHALPGMDQAQAEMFQRGRVEFMQSWAFPPEGGSASGLGPLFNRIACAACHQKNGRGRSPNSSDERMLSMLVRLSVPGQGEHGSPRPHPAYGGQLNEEGAPGVPGEGRAVIHWQESTVVFRDGARASLRKPKLEFTDLAYGPPGKMLASPRIGQPVYGLGLLEAVPRSTLERLASEGKAHGLNGRLNEVWDVTGQQKSMGRFGLKANSPSLRQQIAEAFLGDMGVTTPLFPTPQCTEAQTACRQLPDGKEKPELSAARLDDIEFYLAHLSPPARRTPDAPEVRNGERLFVEIGCAACHQPTLAIADHPKFPLIKAQRIAAYTDLLLHDMGPGLSDGRPDFKATAQQWRTPPLWGIGLVPVVNGHSQYLHDGRARNLEEAVLWHGGEARAAAGRYRRLDSSQRKTLLTFLNSL